MSVTITANFDEISSLAKTTEDIARLLSVVGVPAVNKVAGIARERSHKAILSQVALTGEYVNTNLTLTPASAQTPVAVITGRGRGTTLSRFAARQEVVAVKNPQRAKGDKRRGIAAGMKAAGISVNVKTGAARATISRAFFLPLRAGGVAGANGQGVFTRRGGVLKHRYGPSVNQVFHRVAIDIEKSVADDLQATIARDLDELIRNQR